MQRISQSLRLGTLDAGLSTIVLVYLPTQIYSGNPGEFTFLFFDAWQWLYRVAIAMVLAVLIFHHKV